MMKVPRQRKRRRHKKGVCHDTLKMSCLILYVGVEPRWMLLWVCILLTLTYIGPLGCPLLYLIDHPIGTPVVFVIEFVSKCPTILNCVLCHLTGTGSEEPTEKRYTIIISSQGNKIIQQNVWFFPNYSVTSVQSNTTLCFSTWIYKYETVNYIYHQKAVRQNVCIGKQKNQENTTL